MPTFTVRFNDVKLLIQPAPLNCVFSFLALALMFFIVRCLLTARHIIEGLFAVWFSCYSNMEIFISTKNMLLAAGFVVLQNLWLPNRARGSSRAQEGSAPADEKEEILWGWHCGGVTG